MKISIRLIVSVVMAIGLFHGCTKNETGQFPDTPPAEVVERFYRLLSEGGKLSIKEALMMTSTKYRVMDLNDFRRWTERFNKDTKYKVIGTELPEAHDKNGDWIASVNLEVRTPSSFGDYFSTTSKVNVILDEEKNMWKVDFMADSIDESDFLKAPAEARVEEGEAG